MEHVLPQVDRGNDTFEVRIDFNDLTIEKQEIISILGYAQGTIPPHFEELIDDIFSQLPEYCDIRAGYRILDVKGSIDRHDGLTIGGKFFTLQNIVTTQLRKSEKAALFICTIGNAMETWSRTLIAEGDVPLGYLVDTVASVTAEQAVDVLQNHIERALLQQGLNSTNRYSPGYCNWSVSEQHLLFSFFPKNFCGITLTESALMLPMKSVSGVIGLGGKVQRTEYICENCNVQECTYRAILEAKRDRTKTNLHA
jgi:hypothetical protein